MYFSLWFYGYSELLKGIKLLVRKIISAIEFMVPDTDTRRAVKHYF